MDKTTKAFVIAACSVVIAIPLWNLAERPLKCFLVSVTFCDDYQRLIEQHIDDEAHRRNNREWLCQQRADWDDQLNSAWVAKCMRSTAPVDEV